MSKTEIPQLPEGCGYTGYDFGANYIDSQCFGGRLYDLDNGEPGGILYEPADYKPCPDCCHEEWLVSILEQCGEEGMIAAHDGKPCEPPYVSETLRYPDDFGRMCEAWRKGWKAESGQ